MTMRPRYLVQLAILVFFAYVAVAMYLFWRWAMGGGAGFFMPRPAEVESLVPISVTLGIRSWLGGQGFDPVKPAGAAILLSGLAVSLAARRSLCGWLCPIGTVFEAVRRFGRRHIAFARKARVPKWLDVPLRGIRYLLAFQLFGMIAFTMPLEAVVQFQSSAYNRTSEFKMLLTYLRPQLWLLITLAVLFGAALLVENAWCRYICPIGPMTQLVGALSPVAIRRTESCIDCGKCSRACPQRIDVAVKRTVRSVECTSCMECVAVCPVPGALEERAAGRIAFTERQLAVLVAVVLFGGITIARVTGHYETATPVSVFIQEIQRMAAGG